mmetsp:Transcript_163498/g.524227  ORF Transcript_163498/g.524227 Transcript_163498/m.524227 type:complete len:243 (-) Transcript_163498:2177-2905(-)
MVGVTCQAQQCLHSGLMSQLTFGRKQLHEQLDSSRLPDQDAVLATRRGEVAQNARREKLRQRCATDIGQQVHQDRDAPGIDDQSMAGNLGRQTCQSTEHALLHDVGRDLQQSNQDSNSSGFHRGLQVALFAGTQTLQSLRRARNSFAVGTAQHREEQRDGTEGTDQALVLGVVEGQILQCIRRLGLLRDVALAKHAHQRPHAPRGDNGQAVVRRVRDVFHDANRCSAQLRDTRCVQQLNHGD